jgi:hypothetical protein
MGISIAAVFLEADGGPPSPRCKDPVVMTSVEEPGMMSQLPGVEPMTGGL